MCWMRTAEHNVGLNENQLTELHASLHTGRRVCLLLTGGAKVTFSWWVQVRNGVAMSSIMHY